MIMNLGIRYDTFIPSDSSVSILLVQNKVKQNLLTRKFSPRVGVSLPIADKGIFISYGHFYQMPTHKIYIGKVILELVYTYCWVFES